jgi:glycosyltransferase involved in cell wall biosynthesis
MRLGIDATCLWNRRGFGRFTSELLRAMAANRRGHDLTLLVDREADSREMPPDCRVLNARPKHQVTKSAVAGGRRSPRDMWAFTRAVKRLQPHVFFFPAVYSFFPLPRRVPAVVCFHDTIAESFPDLVFPDRWSRWSWGAKVWLALRQATRVMTVSQSSRDSLVKRFAIPLEKVDLVTEGPGQIFRVQPDGRGLPALLERLGIPPGGRYLLHVGGLSPHKNLATLLRAMPQVLRAGDVHLVLVGDDRADGFFENAAQLRAQAAAEPLLAGRCHFTGYLADEELVELYNGAWALVFPSLCEGFGLPAVEAMACGIPVVASRVGSLPEVIGDAGLYFSPLDVDDMAAAIGRMLQDEGLRRQLAARAGKRASLFTWERAAAMAYDSLERAAS